MPPDVVAALRKSYARKYHSDTGATGDSARLAEINDAIDILGDPEKRAHYDRKLRNAESARAAAANPFRVRALTLTVDPPAGAELSGQPYLRRLRGDGGTSPYTWSLIRG